jgi:enamine deaminase RidA (YjgF/YER057c/UK114 family)
MSVRTDFTGRAWQVLHVKSLSEWAPLCIGPYSQANVLGEQLILLAGQIALEPATMQMVRGSLATEVSQALRNCAAVLASLESSLTVSLLVIVYVKAPPDGEVPDDAYSSLTVGCRPDDGKSLVVTGLADEFVGELLSLCGESCQQNAGVRACASPEESESEPSDAEAEPNDPDDCIDSAGLESNATSTQPPLPPSCPLFLTLGVPALPREASVEFEVVSLSSSAASKLRPSIDKTEVIVSVPFGPSEPFPLPQPFQPPIPWWDETEGAGSTGEGSCVRLRAVCEAASIPAVLSLAVLTISMADMEDPGSSLSYEDLGVAVTKLVRQALSKSSLAWRQLMHLRMYFAPTVLCEASLRDGLFIRMMTEAGGMAARTFVPVACLPGNALLIVQVTAFDLAKLKSELWVHDTS